MALILNYCSCWYFIWASCLLLLSGPAPVLFPISATVLKFSTPAFAFCYCLFYLLLSMSSALDLVFYSCFCIWSCWFSLLLQVFSIPVPFLLFLSCPYTLFLPFSPLLSALPPVLWSCNFLLLRCLFSNSAKSFFFCCFLLLLSFSTMDQVLYHGFFSVVLYYLCSLLLILFLVLPFFFHFSLSCFYHRPSLIDLP
jgi:hypothetical protein